MATNTTTGIPRYQKIFDEFRTQIEAGTLAPGTQMPTFVELKERESISRGTVEQVYMRLEREGLIKREQGRGTFVAERQTQATGQIGFIGTGFALRHRLLYDAHVVDGVESILPQTDLRILLLSEDSVIGWDKVDGLLISAADPLKIAPLLPPGLPAVSLFNPIEGIAAVTPDDYGGGKVAARELLSLGHQRVGCLMQMSSPRVRLRVMGLCDGLRQAGLEPDPRLVFDPHMERPDEGYRAWGYLAMKTWLKGDWQSLACTAIFTQNDLAAMGVIDALKEGNIDVPGDVSVLSFDGTEVCDYFSPTIAAVQVPLFRIGATGMELLLKQISDGPVEPTLTLMPTRFKAGASLAVPKVPKN